MSEYLHDMRAGSCNDDASWPVLICLLGNFRLLVAGELVLIRAGGKREALLAYLALQSGRRVARERLVQTLWPTNDLALGLNSLNNLVYQLHKLLSPALQGAVPVLHEEGYYRLNIEAGIGVDVSCFDLLAETGDRQLQAGDAAAALVAYHRAAEMYRDDLSLLVDAHTVHRLVMRCFMRRGERAAALHQYQVCLDLLRAEFGIAPEPETVMLFAQIREHPDHI